MFPLSGNKLTLKNIKMGKTFTNMNGEPQRTEVSDTYDRAMVCATNGNYCLKGCNYSEDNKCLKHEMRKQELKKEKK